MPVVVDIPIMAAEYQRILRGPSSDLRIVIASPEKDERGIGIVQSTCEAERMKPGVGIVKDDAEIVVVEALDHPSIAGHDCPNAPDLIAHEPVFLARLCHEVGNCASWCEYKLRLEHPVSVIPTDSVEIILV